ncbi:DUF6549 family protein [Flavobacterium sp.]|uniref:DUF6549 family protein n=1 Tax=Flavobacterium sp. TaxID=239 RepID=UPI0022BD7837|nr:DUF6549 family protein [Flavobacterium sp.]MCZ8144857.1 hypothetical protein [Flavobacterium sp.]
MTRKDFIYGTLLVVLMLFSTFQCNGRLDAEKRSLSNLNALIDTVKHYKNAIGTETAKVSSLQLTNKELKNSLSETEKKLVKPFHKVKSLVTSGVKVNVPVAPIAFDKPIIPDGLPCDSLKQNFERTGAVFNKNYEFGYRVTNDSLYIEPFSTSSEITVVTGFQRKWFWGRSTLVTEVTPTNRTWTVTSVTGKAVVEPIKWHQTTLAKMIAGFIIFRTGEKILIE